MYTSQKHDHGAGFSKTQTIFQEGLSVRRTDMFFSRTVYRKKHVFSSVRQIDTFPETLIQSSKTYEIFRSVYFPSNSYLFFRKPFDVLFLPKKCFFRSHTFEAAVFKLFLFPF